MINEVYKIDGDNKLEEMFRVSHNHNLHSPLTSRGKGQNLQMIYVNKQINKDTVTGSPLH